MKKALILASVASMIEQFNLRNIEILQELGYEVHVATNFKNSGTINHDKAFILKENLEKKNVKCFQIDFPRGIGSLRDNMRAFNQLKKLVKNEYYLVHCHSPIGGVLGRLVFWKKSNKVIYTAHGFHFFKGGPKKNWLVFYPVEFFLSMRTDLILTINNDDTKVSKKFPSVDVVQVPGVGIDWNRFQKKISITQEKEIRKFYKLKENSRLILSVGELSSLKNHILGVKAFLDIKTENIEYIICGIGPEEQNLRKLVKENDLENQVHLLGYQTAIENLMSISEIFLFPSRREGLGLAALEAMAAGLPIISSNVGGIKDYMEDGRTGCILDDLDNPKELAKKIDYLLNIDLDAKKDIAKRNKVISRKYDKMNVDKMMRDIYSSF
ncbi:glycosyltransferase [Enterococcus canintestini]|uniref:Uncharacterized protein n=1 Tax=Enterococcus canintestini TaxID=317010 RepID=A0A267HW31_9ENTE|nr:glycosyltransferase [Enterococcus canintestini]PAB01865.1 hypothetical protein AKL21_02735 [Enterococcus canintestini]